MAHVMTLTTKRQEIRLYLYFVFANLQALSTRMEARSRRLRVQRDDKKMHQSDCLRTLQFPLYKQQQKPYNKIFGTLLIWLKNL